MSNHKESDIISAGTHYKPGSLKRDQRSFSNAYHFEIRKKKKNLTDTRIPLESPLALLNSRPALHQTLFLLINCTIRSLQIRGRMEKRKATSFPENNTIISAPLDRNVWFHSPLPFSPISKNTARDPQLQSPPISTQTQRLQLGFNICAWGLCIHVHTYMEKAPRSEPPPKPKNGHKGSFVY